MNLRLLFRQVIVLTGEEFRDLFRRRRVLLCLALYLSLAFLVARGAAWFQDRLHRISGGLSVLSGERERIEQFLRQQEMSEFLPIFDLLEKVPSSVWIFQLFAIMAVPTLAAWLSSDMVAVDVQRRTLRYVLLRARRGAYVISKLLAHTALLAAVHSIVVLLALWWGWQLLSSSVFGLFAEYLLLYTVIMLPFLLMTVTGTALVSVLCTRPVIALLLANGLWIGATVLMFLVPWISPYNGRILLGLLLPHGEHLWFALLGTIGWGALFGAAAVLIFQRREV